MSATYFTLSDMTKLSGTKFYINKNKGLFCQCYHLDSLYDQCNPSSFMGPPCIVIAIHLLGRHSGAIKLQVLYGHRHCPASNITHLELGHCRSLFHVFHASLRVHDCFGTHEVESAKYLVAGNACFILLNGICNAKINQLHLAIH